MYFDELLKKMNSGDYELDCAAFEAVNFEVKETFTRSVASFVISGSYPILNCFIYTVNGDIC